MTIHNGKFIDLHCHILPGIDDGPQDVAQACQLVQALESIGFAAFFPTPHQKASSFAPSVEDMLHAKTALELTLAKAGSRVTIHEPASENMWDELFFQRQDGQFPTYPGGKTFLIELPLDTIPPGFFERLFQFRVEGRLPVVAHIERYPDLTRNVPRIDAMGNTVALQVNLSALGGIEGWGRKRLARKLVSKGLVHVVATDAHTLDDASYSQRGIKWIAQHLGDEVLWRLLVENPRRIIAGELPEKID